MHGDPFDTLLRSFAAAPSRRGLLRLLAGSALGGLLPLAPQPSQAKKKGKGKTTLCHQGQTMPVRKKAKSTHLKHGDTLGACPSSSPPPPPPPPPPAPVLTYQCSGPSETYMSNSSADVRYAQTFIAEQSGTLQQIQFEVYKNAGSTGDYVIELLAVDSDGKPMTNTSLAQTFIANTTVPDGPSTMTGTFPSYPLLSAGTEYAAALSRPFESPLSVGIRMPNDCTGKTFRQLTIGSGPFEESGGLDLVTSVTVLP